ncbi:hypothetical protein ABH925_002139 [Streptacidiphilus sp. EB129]
MIVHPVACGTAVPRGVRSDGPGGESRTPDFQPTSEATRAIGIASAPQRADCSWSRLLTTQAQGIFAVDVSARVVLVRAAADRGCPQRRSWRDPGGCHGRRCGVGGGVIPAYLDVPHVQRRVRRSSQGVGHGCWVVCGCCLMVGPEAARVWVRGCGPFRHDGRRGCLCGWAQMGALRLRGPVARCLVRQGRSEGVSASAPGHRVDRPGRPMAIRAEGCRGCGCCRGRGAGRRPGPGRGRRAGLRRDRERALVWRGCAPFVESAGCAHACSMRRLRCAQAPVGSAAPWPGSGGRPGCRAPGRGAARCGPGVPDRGADCCRAVAGGSAGSGQEVHRVGELEVRSWAAAGQGCVLVCGRTAQALRVVMFHQASSPMSSVIGTGPALPRWSWAS